jgi:hypothetical protein
MRRGTNPRLLWDAEGHLVAFGTGSDACAEHECGSRPMLQALTDGVQQNDALVDALRQARTVVYPSLLEQRRIVRHDLLQFIEVPATAEARCEAYFGFARCPLTECRNELNFPHPAFSRGMNVDLAGAWSENSFAIRVRGEKLVTALRDFYQDVRKGHGVFAGLFLRGAMLTGVVVANERRLTEEHRAGLSRAQAEYESKLRLRSRDDSAALAREMMAVHPKGASHSSAPGYLWAVWADKEESEVRYALNPGYGIPADYCGPYTRQQLLDWAASGYGYQLTNKATAAA